MTYTKHLLNMKFPHLHGLLSQEIINDTFEGGIDGENIS